MLKIYDYNSNNFINENQIQIGMSLRIEGDTIEVNELLQSMSYNTVTEGHEENEIKRVYIKVLPNKMTKNEIIAELNKIFDIELKKSSFKEFKKALELKRIKTGIGYNNKTNRIKSFTTLNKPELEKFIIIVKEVIKEIN